MSRVVVRAAVSSLLVVAGCAGPDRTGPPAAGPSPRIAQPTLGYQELVGEEPGTAPALGEVQALQLERLIRATDDADPQKPDFYFRLGELSAASQRYYQQQQRALEQRIREAPAGERPALEQQDRALGHLRDKWLLQAVSAYVGASKYRGYPRADEVLFRLAVLLHSAKKEEHAREFSHRLIKDHPTSKRVSEAYLAFGEYYFDKGEMPAALRFYERAETFPDSLVQGYAAYKRGWCWINMGDRERAAEALREVLQLAGEGRAGDPRQSAALARAARQDLDNLGVTAGQ
jgi:tetratricopeptide (TPR) repeat protein